MPSGPIDIELLTTQITRMVRAKTGDEVRVRDMAPLPGHAAFGCSFVIERDRPGLAKSDKLVLRMAPEGVRAAGPTDVVLQARRMQSLADSDVPVPPILWYGDEPEFFGRPYFVAAFVDSFKLEDRSGLSADETKALARQGVKTLAALHRVDWRTRRDVWGEPQPLSVEIDRLDRLLDRPTLDPREVTRAPELRDKLRKTAPDVRPGCVHGDFQWNNILFGADRVVALIDWEMAMLGATLLDLGWLCFFAEPGPGTDVSIMCGSTPLGADEIVDIYSESEQFAISKQEVNWFRAFASFRLGVLACFNVMLHRRGKRHDPAWETLVLSSPAMFENGLRLLA